MSAAASARSPLSLLSGSPSSRRRFVRRNTWTIGVYLILFALLIVERLIHPSLDSFDYQNLVIGALPLALVAMGQASVVLIGGIDLSVGSMMSLVNVMAATWMIHASFGQSILLSLLIIGIIATAGAATGLVITLTGIPDIIVTLATSFIWAGLALQVMPVQGGGGAPLEFVNLVEGEVASVIPEAFFILVAVVLLIWLPFFRSRIGLSLYALGSNRTAAFLSGLSVMRTRIVAYALGGVFVALAGLVITATASSGDPNAGGSYTLNSVAAVVLGGVSLAGGRGGMMGPIAAAFVLTIIGTILTFLSVDANWATVIQGGVVVVVVLFAGLITLRRRIA